MIGREYFTIQAATLLKLAKITSSPKAAAALTAKAAELQAKAAREQAPAESPSMVPDMK